LTTVRSQHAWLCCLALVTALFSTVSVAASSTVPLQATIAFTEQVAPSTDAKCLLTGTISGDGSAPRFGTVQLASVDCINALSATSFLFMSDEVVLTVANGDQIWVAYVGTLSAASGAIRGTFFIFGGTGRFENATGAGTIGGSEVLDFSTGAGKGRIQLKGAVTY
jgi:hypothetical protein